MFRSSFWAVLLLVMAIVVFGSARAYAGPDDMEDALVYKYYAVRGASNYMVVNAAATTACTMPAPTGKQVFTYTPIEQPVVDCDPAKAKPIGVGSAASGGNVLDITLDIGPFDEPVDVSLGFFAASFDARDVYFLDISNQITSVQEEMEGESDLQAQAMNKGGDKGNGKGNGQDKHDGQEESGGSDGDVGPGVNDDRGDNNGQGSGSDPIMPKKKLKKLITWKSGVLEANETLLGPTEVTDLSPGLYVLVLNVTRVSPADNNFDRFYRWVTYFIVPDPEQ